MRFPFPRFFLLLLVPVAGCSDKSSRAPTVDGGGDDAPRPSGWLAAVGASGTFAQTFDDIRWDVHELGAAHLYGVACMGNLDGWAVGARGVVAHTVDGGSTWSWQSSGIGDDLRGVRFADRTHGLIVGAGGAMAVTDDAGTHWRSVPTSTDVTLRGAAIAWGTGTWLAVGDRRTVLRSGDSGASWAHAIVDGAGDLRGVAIDPGAHLALVVDAAGGIWSSTDGARTFHREAEAGLALDAVALDDGGAVAVAVGAHGTAMVRDTAGAWRVVPTNVDRDLHAALVTAGGTRIYVGGEGGTLLTRDTRDTRDTRVGQGGWALVPLATTTALYGLEDALN